MNDDSVPFSDLMLGDAASMPRVMEGSGIELLAANDPRFHGLGLAPDDSRAYIRYRIATSFPKVIGPEMHGDYFGFHPQVLVNSAGSLLHKQNNLGHKLKAHGSPRDRIVGAVVYVSVGNARRGVTVQPVPDSEEAALYLDVVAVVHKQAEGVKELLGRHVSSREKTSVSIELNHPLADTGVFDPRDRSVHSLSAAASQWPDLVTVRKKDNRVLLGKVDGAQFAWAPGGESGRVVFSGVGYTPNPAEGNTARVLDLAAAIETGEDTLAFAAAASWQTGAAVRWNRLTAGDAGIGEITDVILAGTVCAHGVRKIAVPHDPLLEIAVSGKNIRVIRHASSVVLVP